MSSCRTCGCTVNEPCFTDVLAGGTVYRFRELERFSDRQLQEKKLVPCAWLLPDLCSACLRPAVPEGTLPPGSRVRKSVRREGDAHGVGALARTVSFPMGPVELEGKQVYGYFVEWDDVPGVPVFVAGDAIELAARAS